MPETMPDYMTTQEVAALARTSPETVRYWRHVGKGPASFKLGRRVLYSREGVLAWIEAAQATPHAGRGVPVA